MEYALLITIAVAIALGMSVAFQGMIRQGITGFNAVLERELRAGNFTENPVMWEN